MRKRLAQILVLTLFIIILYFYAKSNPVYASQPDLQTVVVKVEQNCLTNNLGLKVSVLEESIEYEEEPETQIFYDSITYIAQCVEAEAGNQGYQGKVYVADCIMNRFDQGNYSTYYDVIDEPNQFACVANGSIVCIPSEETYEVVRNELFSRTNKEILYFRTDHYHSFGTPCFKYKDHYFSK